MSNHAHYIENLYITRTTTEQEINEFLERIREKGSGWIRFIDFANEAFNMHHDNNIVRALESVSDLWMGLNDDGVGTIELSTAELEEAINELNKYEYEDKTAKARDLQRLSTMLEKSQPDGYITLEVF